MSVPCSKFDADVLIVGGGTGGCAAAMGATSLGFRVILTEETDWLGGQPTSQLVPPDECLWIGGQGCTALHGAGQRHVGGFEPVIAAIASSCGNITAITTH